jgi:hypothetical protein
MGEVAMNYTILFISLLITYTFISPIFCADTTLVELKKSGVSPGFDKEHIDVSVILNNSIFVGTHPNGHIYKINEYDAVDLQFKDLGPVGEKQGNKFVMSLITVNDKIYGATSFTPYVFKIENPMADQPKIEIISDSTAKGSTFMNKGIRWLYDAAYVKLNKKEYIFFGTWNNRNKFKIVALNINSELIDIIELNVGTTRTKYIAYSGKFKYSDQNVEKPWLIIGTEGAKIVLLNLLNRKEYIEIPVSDLCLKEFGNIVATTDYPGIIWAYNGKGQVIRYDLKDDSSNFLSSESYGAKPVYYKNFLHTQGRHTNGHKFHANHPQRKNQNEFRRLNRGRMKGTHLMVDSVNNRIVSVTGVGLDMRNIYYTSLNYNSNVTTKQIREVPDKIDPSGGGEPMSLAAMGEKVYLSLYDNRTETVFYPDSTSWINRPIYSNPEKICVQADAMLAYDDYLYYGQYSRPYLRRRSLTSEDLSSDDHDLKDIIKAPSQVRVTDMIPLREKNEILLGTGWSVPPSNIVNGLNDRATLLKIDFPFKPDNIFNVGHLDDYRRITNIAASSDNYYIYGIAIDEGRKKYAYTRHGVFVAAYTDLTGPSHEIEVLDFDYLNVSDILTQKVGSREYLYLSIENTIRRYSMPLPVVNNHLNDPVNYITKTLPPSWRVTNLEKSDRDERIYFSCDTRLFSLGVDLEVLLCGEVKSSTNEDRNNIKKITNDPVTGNIYISSADGKIFRYEVNAE